MLHHSSERWTRNCLNIYNLLTGSLLAVIVHCMLPMAPNCAVPAVSAWSSLHSVLSLVFLHHAWLVRARRSCHAVRERSSLQLMSITISGLAHTGSQVPLATSSSSWSCSHRMLPQMRAQRLGSVEPLLINDTADLRPPVYMPGHTSCELAIFGSAWKMCRDSWFKQPPSRRSL